MSVLQADDVAKFLQQHPEFFNQYPQLLQTLKMPHPEGGQLISLHQRQLIALRTQQQQLQQQLDEWRERAQENAQLLHQFNQFTQGIISCTDLSTLTRNVPLLLIEHFDLFEAAFKVWYEYPAPEFIQQLIRQHPQPYCTQQPMKETVTWFKQPEKLQALACLPLGADQPFSGLLILASDDKNRYHPELGTFFLEKIASLVNHAIAVQINPVQTDLNLSTTETS